jgi:hypothetical protein
VSGADPSGGLPIVFRVTAAAVATVLLAAIALVGGESVRDAIGAGTSSYSDPTTTIGDLVTRGDAGVTRLAIGADGSVVTSIGGRAAWRALPGGVTLAGSGVVEVRSGDAGTVDAAGAADASVLTLLNGAVGWQASGGGTVTASQISDSTTTGRAVLTAASEAAARTAIGAQAATWTTVTATSFSRRDGTRGTVVLTGARLDFTVDGAGLAYYDGTARTAARAYYAPPASAAEVALIYRLYTRTSGAAQTYTALVGLLRSGADDTAAPSAASSYFVSPAAITLPGVARYNDGTRIYYGEFNASGGFGTAGTGGVAWPANGVVDGTWMGVRWIAGQIFYGVVVAPSTTPPTPADVQWYTGGAAARWAGPPSLAVLALEQTGGAPSAQAITAECVLYYR